jgi:polyisoprenoid-binding protein YceI
MIRRNICIVGSALFAMCVAWGASAALSKVGTPSVKFFAKGKGLGLVPMTVDGTSESLSVSEKAGKVTLSVPIASLKTGNDTRDRHMKDKYLHAGKFPTVTLSVARAALEFPQGRPTSGSAAGELTLHGVTRPRKFSYTATPAGNAIRVTGKVHVNILEHGIEKPEEYGVKIEPGVDVQVAFQVQDI